MRKRNSERSVILDRLRPERRWWKRKSESQFPEMKLPIKDNLGEVIGYISIDKDGNFTGEVQAYYIHPKIIGLSKNGMVSGIKFQLLVEPPTPPWKK